MVEPRNISSRPPKILRPYLVSDRPNDDGEWPAHCPLHKDDDPSAYFNFDKGVWLCHAGCGKGRIKDLVKKLSEGKQEVNDGGEVADLETEKEQRRGSVAPSFELTDEKVSAWNDALVDDSAALHAFSTRRGLTEETVVDFSIGWDKAKRAYTIPIPDKNGKWINVRFYRPDASGKVPKYQNLKGHGKLSLYPIAQLLNKKRDYIVLTEGELDALICIQHGIPAVCGTGGARNWNRAWNQFFDGRRVWIVYDADKTGVLGRRLVLQNLRGVAKSLHVVELPFEYQEEHGKDITDFFVREGRPIEEFRRLLREAEPEAGGKKQAPTSDAITVRVSESYNPAHIGKPMELKATVIGRSITAHALPRHVNYSCTMDAGDRCDVCPMYQNSGEMETEVSATDTALLRFIDVTEEKKADLVRDLMGIVKCNRMTYEVGDHWSVESLIVRSDVDQHDEIADNTQRKVVAVGPHDTKPADSIRFVGTSAPSPKDQTNVFQAWESSRDAAAFESFEMSSDIGQRLEVFQVANGQKPTDKLKDIADDLSAHVTRIYGRTALHVAMDLVYHSAIGFDFAGEPIDRGWLDVLILGDTRTGKSKTAQRLIDHYGLGTMLSCESASFAGIFGGVSQKFGEWVVTWGAVVLNDRRIVVLDEVSALSPGDISQMSAVRSSGIAKLTKIENQEARARARLIWIANPRSGGNLDSATYGVQHIPELVGNNEDIARFDYAMAVSSDEVPFEEMAIDADRTDPKYPRVDARNLIHWVWSRRANQIVITPEATRAINEYAVKLAHRYTETPPLVQSANIRQKLARVAVAIAGRLFSTDDQYEKLIVLPEHAHAAFLTIRSFYDAPHFGYRHSSMQIEESKAMAYKDRDDSKRWLAGYEELVRFFKQLRGQGFTKWELQDATGWDTAHTSTMTANMFKRGLVTHEKGRMTMTPMAHDLIREL